MVWCSPSGLPCEINACKFEPLLVFLEPFLGLFDILGVFSGWFYVLVVFVLLQGIRRNLIRIDRGLFHDTKKVSEVKAFSAASERLFVNRLEQTKVVTSEKIRMHYLRSPLYWAHWLGVTVYFWVLAANAPLLINLVKIVRGSAFIKLPDSLWRLRDTSWVRVATPVTLLMGASHWVACLLFCLGGPLDKANEEGWSYFETVFRNETVSGQVSGYIVSYVEAIYMLTGSLDGPTGAGAREGNFGALVMVLAHRQRMVFALRVRPAMVRPAELLVAICFERCQISPSRRKGKQKGQEVTKKLQHHQESAKIAAKR